MRRCLVAGLALAAALGAAGCGFGAGPSAGSGAELAVTRDYGHRLLDDARVAHVHQSDTVMRFVLAGSLKSRAPPSSMSSRSVGAGVPSRGDHAPA